MKTLRDIVRTVRVIVGLLIVHYRVRRMELRLARRAKRPNYVFTSGDLNAVKLDDSDRRFFIDARRRSSKHVTVTKRIYSASDPSRPIAEHHFRAPWWRR